MASGPIRRGSTICGCRRCGSHAAARALSCRRPAWCRLTITARALRPTALDTGERLCRQGFLRARGRGRGKVSGDRCQSARRHQAGHRTHHRGHRRAGRRGLRGRAEGREVEHRGRSARGKDDSVRCDVVELYGGGVYDLYKYRRYQDVRLVFAPGGVERLFRWRSGQFRVSTLQFRRQLPAGSTVNGRPLDTSANYLRYAKADARAGDLVFTSGSPGSTNRLETVAQLESRRDVSLRDIFWNARSCVARSRNFPRRGPSGRASRRTAAATEHRERAEERGKGRFAVPHRPADHPGPRGGRAGASRQGRPSRDETLRSGFGAAWDSIKADARYAASQGPIASIFSRITGASTRSC